MTSNPESATEAIDAPMAPHACLIYFECQRHPATTVGCRRRRSVLVATAAALLVIIFSTATLRAAAPAFSSVITLPDISTTGPDATQPNQPETTDLGKFEAELKGGVGKFWSAIPIQVKISMSTEPDPVKMELFANELSTRLAEPQRKQGTEAYEAERARILAVLHQPLPYADTEIGVSVSDAKDATILTRAQEKARSQLAVEAELTILAAKVKAVMDLQKRGNEVSQQQLDSAIEDEKLALASAQLAGFKHGLDKRAYDRAKAAIKTSAPSP